ncbi:MAG: hypothetical protein ACFB0G_09370 [Leptolyngbyaceae cyanobacterium]
MLFKGEVLANISLIKIGGKAKLRIIRSGQPWHNGSQQLPR